MKKLIIVASLGLAIIAKPTTAKTNDEALAAVGGFLVGMIVTDWVKDHHHHHHRYHTHEQGSSKRKIIHHKRYPKSRGHYEYRTLKKWVPGYWEYERDVCDHPYKVWHPGYYVYRKEKVWIDSPPRHSRHSHPIVGYYR